MLPQVYIKGLGYYVPDRILNNAELSTLVETSDEWIRTRTGIEQRRIARPDQTCSDLAVPAAQRALAASGTAPNEITNIITATGSGDAFFPATAVRVQHKLGIKNAMSFDLSAACSGFIYGLETARGLLAVNPGGKVLLTAAEVLSRRTNWSDRSTCVLFGDGAGAAVLSTDAARPATGSPLAASALVEGVICDADGAFFDLLYCNGGCSDHSYKLGDIVGPEHFICMQGREVFKHAVRSMSAVCKKLMERLGLAVNDFDLVIPHQANLRIIQAVGERLQVPEGRVFVNVHKYGNTSAASIPLALAEALEQGVIRPGMRVLCATFGAGLTWGAASLKF